MIRHAVVQNKEQTEDSLAEFTRAESDGAGADIEESPNLTESIIREQETEEEQEHLDEETQETGNFLEIDQFHQLYNWIKDINFCRIDSKSLSQLADMLWKEAGEQKICFKTEKDEEEFETYVRQIISTCKAFGELLHIQYPPEAYKVEAGDGGAAVVSRTDDARRKNISNFIEENKDGKFHPFICQKYKEIIIESSLHDPYYKPQGNSKYKQAEYTYNEANDRINAVDEASDYCIYRTMAREQWESLNRYFRVKAQVENIIKETRNPQGRPVDILDFVAPEKYGEQKKQIKKLCGDQPPVIGHMGNFTQALTYGGILVKFMIKRDKAGLLTHEYLARGGTREAGGEGSTLGNKIGVKSEQHGDGKFSFNLAKSFWTSILFLSTVERFESYDLRKKEGGRTEETDLPFDMRRYKP